MSLIESLLKVALLGAEWVLWLLIILSVVSLTISVERWWFFFRNNRAANNLRAALNEALGKGDRAVDELWPKFACIESEVLEVAWKSREGGPEAISEALAGQFAVARPRLDSGLTFLGIVGSNAPFIGLVGTVIGVIEAFHALGLGGDADMGLVMALIAEALVATGVGIVVAIPAVVAYNNGQARVASVEEETAALGKVISAALRTRAATTAHAAE